MTADQTAGQPLAHYHITIFIHLNANVNSCLNWWRLWWRVVSICLHNVRAVHLFRGRRVHNISSIWLARRTSEAKRVAKSNWCEWNGCCSSSCDWSFEAMNIILGEINYIFIFHHFNSVTSFIHSDISRIENFIRNPIENWQRTEPLWISTNSKWNTLCVWRNKSKSHWLCASVAQIPPIA